MVAVVHPHDLGAEFDIGFLVPNKISIRSASDVAAGVVMLAVSSDYPAPFNNLDAATPGYVQAAIAAIAGGLHVPATMFIAGGQATALTVVAGGVDNQTFTLTPNAAAGNAYGVVQLAVGADYPQPANDIDAVTPLYLQNALATLHDAATITTATPAVVITTAGPFNQAFTIDVSLATTLMPGIVALAVGADYPSPLNDVDAATPAYVAAAIAAIPAGHVPATASSIGAAAAALTIVAGGVDNQTFTFQPNAATSAAYGVVQLATAADYPSPLNDVDAATPAYVAAAIAAIPAGHVPATMSSTTPALTVVASGVDNQTFTLNIALATAVVPGINVLPTLDLTDAFLVHLATAYP